MRPVDELMAFLKARLDEDERVARHASHGPWVSHVGYISGGPTGMTRVTQQAQAWNADHIARHDPARVLREVEAKRRILDEHYPVDPCDAHDASARTIPCDTLLLLALPYAGHEAYREEWRP